MFEASTYCVIYVLVRPLSIYMYIYGIIHGLSPSIWPRNVLLKYSTHITNCFAIVGKMTPT